jgi:hypothetical protein
MVKLTQAFSRFGQIVALLITILLTSAASGEQPFSEPKIDRTMNCGPYCMLVIMNAMGIECSLEDVLAECPTVGGLTSFGELQRYARTKGLDSELVTVDSYKAAFTLTNCMAMAAIRDPRNQAFAEKKNLHLVVLLGEDERGIAYIDLNNDSKIIFKEPQIFEQFFAGYLLLVAYPGTDLHLQTGRFDRYANLFYLGIAAVLGVVLVMVCNRFQRGCRSAKAGVVVSISITGAVLCSCSGDLSEDIIREASGDSLIEESSPEDSTHGESNANNELAWHTVLHIDPSPLQDFGVLLSMPDAPLRHTFTVSNISQEPIEIENVKPSCSCLKVTTSQIESALAPGESFEIYASLHVTDAGETDALVLLGGSVVDGLPFFAKLPVSVKAWNRINVTPNKIVFRGTPGATLTRELTLVIPPNEEGVAYEVMNTETSTGVMLVPRSKSTKDTDLLEWNVENVLTGTRGENAAWVAREYTYDVQTVVQLETHVSEKTVTFVLNDSANSRLTVPIEIDIMSGVEAIPRTVYFGSVRHPIRRTIKLKVVDDTLQVQSIDTVDIEPDGTLAVRKVSRGPGMMAIEVEAIPQWEGTRRITGKIRIHLNAKPNAFSLDVPFSGVF